MSQVTHRPSVLQQAHCGTAARVSGVRRKHNIQPGNVMPSKPFPAHIPSPPYVQRSWAQSVLNRFQRERPRIKTDKEIQGMRTSCAIARDVLATLTEKAKPGISTEELDALAQELCIEKNAYPSPLRYKKYPKSICTSVNNVACHGIPDDRQLESGDIINIDVTVSMHCVGKQFW